MVKKSIGETYVIYAWKVRDGSLSTNICTTAALAKAKETRISSAKTQKSRVAAVGRFRSAMRCSWERS